MRSAWEPQLGRRSCPDLAVQAEDAVGLLGEAVDHAETKPAALPDLFGGEEWFENLFEMLRRNSAAGVGHTDSDIFASHDSWELAVANVAILGLHGHRSTRWHGIAGVDDQVDEGKLELGAVGEEDPDALAHFPFEMHQSAEGVREKVRDRLAKRAQLDRSGLQPLPPRKSEQLTNELAALFGRALGHSEHPLLLLAKRGPLLQ